MASQSESVTKADHPTSTKMEPSVNDHGDQSGHVAFDEPITEEALGEDIDQVESGKKKKVPRRIIHFIDGDTLEEYSTDEESELPSQPPPVDPKSLDWLPWFWFWLVLVATKSLAAADFMGERLAWFFGITAPKYQYIIDEYHRIKEEAAEDERLEESELRERLNENIDSHNGGDKGLSVDNIHVLSSDQQEVTTSQSTATKY